MKRNIVNLMKIDLMADIGVVDDGVCIYVMRDEHDDAACFMLADLIDELLSNEPQSQSTDTPDLRQVRDALELARFRIDAELARRREARDTS